MFKKIKLRLFFLLFSCLLVQATFIPYLSVFNVKPVLCCALFVSLVCHIPNVHVIYLAFVIGVLQDLLSNYFFGIHIISLLVPAVFIPFIIKKIDTRNFCIRFLLVFLFSCGSLIIYSTAFVVSEKLYFVFSDYLSLSIKSAFYTALFSIGVDYFVKKIIPLKTPQYELF